MTLRSVEPGRCLWHGYVTERCCEGWEPKPPTTFLLNAIRRVRLQPATSPAPDDLARSGDGMQGRSGAAEVASSPASPSEPPTARPSAPSLGAGSDRAAHLAARDNATNPASPLRGHS